MLLGCWNNKKSKNKMDFSVLTSYLFGLCCKFFTQMTIFFLSNAIIILTFFFFHMKTPNIGSNQLLLKHIWNGSMFTCSHIAEGAFLYTNFGFFYILALVLMCCGFPLLLCFWKWIFRLLAPFVFPHSSGKRRGQKRSTLVRQ